MTILIAAGTSAAQSASFALTDGESITLALLPSGAKLIGPEVIQIEAEVDSGKWIGIGALSTSTPFAPLLVLQATGTYRVVRPAQEIAVGAVSL